MGGSKSPIGTGKFTNINDVVDPLGFEHDQGRGVGGFDAGRSTSSMVQEASHNQNMASAEAGAAEATANGIDQTSGKEVADLIASGNPLAASQELADAKAGKGIYAVRKINENQSKLINAQPGRSQLSGRYQLVSSAVPSAM